MGAYYGPFITFTADSKEAPLTTLSGLVNLHGDYLLVAALQGLSHTPHFQNAISCGDVPLPLFVYYMHAPGCLWTCLCTFSPA